MPTQCSAERFDFGMVEGRVVEAAFDAGLVTSDAGGLLLGLPSVLVATAMVLGIGARTAPAPYHVLICKAA